MIDRTESMLVSHLASIDGSALNVIDLTTGSTTTYECGAAEKHVLVSGINSHFALVRHLGGGCLQITARVFSNPGGVLSTLHVENSGERFEGPIAAWENLPRAYLFEGPGRYNLSESKLALVSVRKRQAYIRPFPPENDILAAGLGEADGVVDSMSGPLVVTGRTGQVHLVDPVKWKITANLVPQKTESKTARGAFFRKASGEFWVADGTTLRVYQKGLFSGWSESRQLQFEPGDAVTLGPVSLIKSLDENYCAIVRPSRQNVVVIDCNSFKILRHITLTESYESVALLNSGRLVSRSPSSGELVWVGQQTRS